ncbi:MAG: DUF3221 domain-containing protein [Gemmatimonadaceae bacterium]
MRSTILLAATVLAACSSGKAVDVPTSTPAVSGTVTRITAGGTSRLGTILIEEVPSDSSGSAKFSVTIVKETGLFTEDREIPRPVVFDSLKVGQKVKAWFTGPVMESYPAQARAQAIVIVRR